MLKKYLLLFAAVAILQQSFAIPVLAAENYCQTSASEYTCQPSRFIQRLKNENLIMTRNLSKISADTAKCNDVHKFVVFNDITLCNKVIVPCGSIIEGKVVRARKNMIFRTDAFVDLVVTNIQTGTTCINLEKTPIEMRITDYRYKGLVRRTVQRAPVVIANTATSIALNAATNMAGGVVFAITTGAGVAAGLISGFLDPDIDKSRIDGAIVRGVEGTALGTFLLTVEEGYDVKFPESCIVVMRFNEEGKQKLACAIEQTAISSR
jgi:hypothetical protein